ncbi:MAG TPA: hypothetical protein VFO36_05810 [Nitrospiraceae bacterium]|nr:hypothetical protein [Nitrospiraceae bacterium]
MNWNATRGPLKHLGKLRGRGDLLIRDGAHNLGPVTYEIDGYARRSARSDNGHIEGEADMLTKAFRAGSATIVLADGQLIQVALSDPAGSSMAEVRLSNGFPRFGCGA